MEKNESLLKFNKKFYNMISLDSTIQQFEGICQIEVTEDDDFFYLSFKLEKSDDPDTVCSEFANHFLVEVRNRGVNK